MPAVEVEHRVAFLFAHLHRGGMQRAVSNLTRALPARFHSYVVFYGTDNPSFGFDAECVNLDVAGSMGSGPFTKAANAVARVSRLNRFVRERRIDTVVSMGEIANVINSVARVPRRVLSVRSAPTASLADSGSYAPVYSVLRRLLYPRADAVVAVSRAIADELRDRYHVPGHLLTVIHNLYDPDVIRRGAEQPLPAEWSWLEGRDFVVAVGALAEHKGQRELIRALVLARRAVPDLELVLVGDGPALDELQALASGAGLEGHVHFTGFQDNPHAFVSRAVALALPSHFEGFPNALVEAMLCGVPVVATDCPTGPREILGDSEHGLLVPAMSAAGEEATVRGLGRALQDLAADPLLRARYRDAATKRALDFHAARAVEAWVRILAGPR